MIPSRYALAVPALVALPLALSACDVAEVDPDDFRRATVVQVVVEDAPLFRENGDRWDGGVVPTGPDVFFRLLGNNDVEIIDASSDLTTTTGARNYSDVDDNDFPLVWDVPAASEFVINDLDRTLVFELRDADPLDTEEMGRTETFRLRDFVEDTASQSFVVRSDDGDISIRMRVRFDD